MQTAGLGLVYKKLPTICVVSPNSFLSNQTADCGLKIKYNPKLLNKTIKTHKKIPITFSTFFIEAHPKYGLSPNSGLFSLVKRQWKDIFSISTAGVELVPPKKRLVENRSVTSTFTSKQQRRSVTFCKKIRCKLHIVCGDLSDCYKIDTKKKSYHNEKSYISIAQNVAFNLAEKEGFEPVSYTHLSTLIIISGINFSGKWYGP